jgi:hypothetical protein
MMGLGSIASTMKEGMSKGIRKVGSNFKSNFEQKKKKKSSFLKNLGSNLRDMGKD